MSERGRRISPMVAGLIAGVFMAVVVGIMAKINLDFAAPWTKTHTLTMQVVDADGIGVSSDVRVAGRLVGQVTGVTSKGDHTDVVFHLDDSEWPLPTDTTASIRLATLLGQKYVELQPGADKSAHIADNGVIGTDRTKPVVDFDQILDTFDKPTRTALTDVIKTGGAAVRLQEGTLQQLLPDLRDLSVHSVTPTGELVKRDPEFNAILVNLGVTADQLDRSREDLAGVIDNLNSVTGALASHSDALRGFIRNTDQLNQTTNLVLGNGGAAEFNAGLQRIDTLTKLVDHTFTAITPATYGFGHDRYAPSNETPLQMAIDMIASIADTGSQSDVNGPFLRQSAQGIDCSGLVTPVTRNIGQGIPCPPSSQPSNGSSGSGGKSTGPGGGILPLPLPTLPLPTPSLPTSPLPLPPILGPGGTLLVGYSFSNDTGLADYGLGGEF
jgi:phospholipid/cholesterol/gamma-HCH transport system substrate-binding protein